MTTTSATGPAPVSAPWPIGRITLGVKRTGKRRTGNPFAPFEVAGAGDGLTANLHGHEAGNGGYSQGEPAGHRASPRPYYALSTGMNWHSITVVLVVMIGVSPCPGNAGAEPPTGVGSNKSSATTCAEEDTLIWETGG